MAVKFTFLGHSTFQIDIDEISILIDPFLTGNPAATVSAESLNPDIILVSHGHEDHIADAVNIAKRTDALVISNFEICEWLKKQGVTNVHAQNIGGAYMHPHGINIKQTIAHHSSVLPDGIYGGNPSGFLIEVEEGNIYYAGDTALFGDMQLYRTKPVDVAILPIGDNFTMGPEDSLTAIYFLQAYHVIPCHYNTWDVINQDVDDWAERVSAGTDATPIVLKPGEEWEL